MGAMQQMLLAGGAQLSIVIAPTTLFTTASTATITSPNCGTTVTGGSGTYTYLWSVSAQTGTKTVQINAATVSTTFFYTTLNSTGTEGICNAICTVTDTVTSLVAVSNIANVDLTHT